MFHIINYFLYTYTCRFSRSNRLFAGIWFGKGKPHFSTFMKPICESINNLYLEGENYYVRALGMQNSVQDSGAWQNNVHLFQNN